MAETLTGATIAGTYKTLLKAGSNNPVALGTGSSSSERLVEANIGTSGGTTVTVKSVIVVAPIAACKDLIPAYMTTK